MLRGGGPAPSTGAPPRTSRATAAQSAIARAVAALTEMSGTDLDDPSKVAKAVGIGELDDTATPRGYRLLAKVGRLGDRGRLQMYPQHVFGDAERNVGAAQLGGVHVGVDPHRWPLALGILADSEQPQLTPFWRGTQAAQMGKLGKGAGPGSQLLGQNFVVDEVLAKAPIGVLQGDGLARCAHGANVALLVAVPHKKPFQNLSASPDRRSTAHRGVARARNTRYAFALASCAACASSVGLGPSF